MSIKYTFVSADNLHYFYKLGIGWYQSTKAYIPCSRKVIGLRLHLSNPLTHFQQNILPFNTLYDQSARTLLIYSKAQMKRLYPTRKFITLN